MSIPFSPQQFETKANRNMRVSSVRVDKVVPTQRYWDQAKVDDIAEKGPKKTGVAPIVSRLDGKYILGDGHHRLAAAIQRGDRTIPVKIAP